MVSGHSRRSSIPTRSAIAEKVLILAAFLPAWMVHCSQQYDKTALSNVR